MRPKTDKKLRKIRELSKVPVIGLSPVGDASESWRAVYETFDWRHPRSKMFQVMDAMGKAYVLEGFEARAW